MKVAAIQMDCVLGEKDTNISKAAKFVKEAIQKGAQLIALPELFSTGYRLDELYYQFSEYIPEGDTVKQFEDIAKENQVYIIGCIVERSEDRGLCYDSAFLVGPQGFIGKTRKAQLWNLEKLYFSPGTLERKVFDTKLCKIGIIICYEAGFPEIARNCAIQGADILVEVSALGMPRLYAWDLLTRSRALENGCFMVVADRIGKEKDSEYCGLSRVISPKGNVLAEAQSEEVIVEEINLEDISSQRLALPYLRDYLARLNK
ncbi:MAG: nitrilase-related carbon-nitrogen hydrolase [Pseudomonadota bacterium]